MRDFWSLYYNHPEQQPQAAEALYWWCVYRVKCEEFDRLRCECRDKYGIAIPTSAWEYKQVRDNSHRLRKQIEPYVAHIDEWIRRGAKKESARMSYKAQKEYIKRYNERTHDVSNHTD